MRRPTAKEIYHRVFIASVYVYVAFACGANAVWFIDDSLPHRDNSIFVASWLFIHAIVIGLGTPYLRTITLRQVSLFGAIASMCLVSIANSVDSPNSIVYSLMLLGNVLCVLIFARRISISQFIRIFHRVILVLAALSIVLFVIGYERVVYIDIHERPTFIGTTPIRGFFSHKILAALYANLGLIMTYVLTRSARQKLLEVALLAVFLVLTGSSAGIVLAVLGLVVVVIYSFLGKRVSFAPIHLLFTVIALIVVLAIMPFFELLLMLLGRDVTLTGRTLLWEWGFTAWLEKPLFGWGMTNYFDTRHATEIKLNYASFSAYDVPHFHNSALQTSVDFGIVGVLLMLTICLFVSRRFYAEFFASRCSVSFAAFLLVIMMIAASTVMHLFITYNHMATIMMMYFAFRLLSKKPFENN